MNWIENKETGRQTLFVRKLFQFLEEGEIRPTQKNPKIPSTYLRREISGFKKKFRVSKNLENFDFFGISMEISLKVTSKSLRNKLNEIF